MFETCLFVSLFVHLLCSQIDDSYACSSADIMYLEFRLKRMFVHGPDLQIMFIITFTVVFLGPSFRSVLRLKLGIT